MQLILRNEEDFKGLLDNTYNHSPDSYPCLAIGMFRINLNGPDGYDYDYVYLIDETRDDLAEKYSLDLTKL